jgi:RNA polymerase primary sigma factor
MKLSLTRGGRRRKDMNYTLEQLPEIIKLSPISDREKKIIIWRLQGKTLQEIGDLFGVSKDRIRQVEARGIRKMRVFFLKNKKVI